MKKKSVLDLKRISQEEFKRVEKISLTVILDNVRSLNNIGSVFRTADAFRVECIYLCGITATPPIFIRQLWEPRTVSTGFIFKTLARLLITCWQPDMRYMP